MAQQQRRSINVNIYLVRHAESCTNVIARRQPWHAQYKRLLYTDPPITNDGKEAAQQLKAALKAKGVKPDLVLSSRLLRAIQTAQELYPRRNVHPVCGLAETVGGTSNKFSSVKNQKPFLRHPERVKYRMETSALKCNDAVDKKWRFFMAELTPILLQLIATRRPCAKRYEPITVVIVSHSQWIQKFLGMQKRKLKNLHTFKLRLKLLLLSDVHDAVLVRPERGKETTTFFDGVAPKPADEADAANCKK